MKVYAQKQSKPQQQVSHNLTRSSAKPSAASQRVHPILHLQRTIGNQAVQRLLQTKLKVNAPGDMYEQEADRVSEQVMRMPEPELQRACACGGGCSTCQTEQTGQAQARVQTKHVGSGDSGQTPAPPSVHQASAATGQPLDTATRAFMEPRFGHDFSRVRVHTDPLAAQSAEAVAAQAYTVGSDVVFGVGRYAPGSPHGQRLLAHELTHVVQQRSGASPMIARTSIGEPCGQCPEAQALAQRTPDPGIIQREPEEGHDLTSPRFAGDPLLEACFDNRARMTQGHRGPSVEKVQQALLDLGYNLGPSGADGIYGPKTWNAVKQFKANEGLGFEHMGDVGPGTMRRLDELFGPKAEKSPTKVADEEPLDACPSGEDIVTALEARPGQLNALVGVKLVGQSASAHVSIADAVSRFKSKVNVTGLSSENVSQTGQFFWVTHMHDAMRTELTLLSSDPTALAFVAKARQAREAIDVRDFATAQRLISELDVIAQTTKSPSKPKMQSLLRANRFGPAGLETFLWNALNADPTNSMPSLAPFVSLRTLMQLEAFDKQSCGFAAQKIAERLLKKGGVTARPDPKAGRFFANLNASGVCMRDRRHTPTAFSPTMLGDVLKQSNVSSAVAQLKQALDAGQLVHARVLSGVGIGTQPNVPFDLNPPVNVGPPPQEHSLVIIGFDGDKFVFSDPDASVSQSPETGFGFLFFDSSDVRLSTAEDASDLVVRANGKHRRGDKRYQVLTLSVF